MAETPDTDTPDTDTPDTDSPASDSGDRADETPYLVVINHEEQYSIWPDDGREIPAGWKAEGKRGSKEACLDHIGEVWTDMRPASVRRRLESSGD